MPVTHAQVLAALNAGNTALASVLLQERLLQQTSTPQLPSFPPTPPPPEVSVEAPQPRPRPRTLRRTQRTPKELQVAVSASEKPVRVCYGSPRIGADIIWIGVDVGWFVFHLRWCWGEIDSITKIQLNDEDLPSGSVVTNYLGTTIQGVDPTLSSIIGGFTDTLIYSVPGGGTRGIAYSVVKIRYRNMPDSINFTCQMDALKVLDTRTSTTAHSTNPALHLYDFLTSDLYGPNWVVDTTTTNSLANMCDTLISGQKRFESHYVMDRQASFSNHIEAMLGAAGAFLVSEDDQSETRPKYKFAENRPGSSAATYDLEAVSADGSDTLIPINRNNIPNRVRVQYTDTSTNPWNETFAESETADVTAGNEIPATTTLSAPFIHSHRVANRLAIEFLNGQRLPEFEIQWTHKDEGVRLQRGDIITLNTIPGFSGAEVVRVLRKSLVRAAGGYFWQIYARQYDASEYSDSVVDYTPPGAPSLGDPFTPDAPTNLVLGEDIWNDNAGRFFSVITATWDGSVSPYARSYRVRVTTVSDTIFEETIHHQGYGESHDITTLQVEQDLLHKVEVWTISTVGAVSAVETDTITPTGRSAVPDDVTNLEATEYPNFVELEWDNVLDPGDTAHRIKRGTQSDTWATADQLDESMFMNEQSFSETRIVWRDYDVGVGDVRYFVKVISFEGLESTNADTVDITIVEPKGSRGKERPRIVRYVNEAQWLHDDYEDFQAVNRLGMVDVDSTSTAGWFTPVDVSGSSGVLQFVIFELSCSVCAGETMELRTRITIDGTVIWDQGNEYVDTDHLANFCIVPVGMLFNDPDSPTAGEDHIDLDFHYLPFENQLKIEAFNDVTGSGIISTNVGYTYFLT